MSGTVVLSVLFALVFASSAASVVGKLGRGVRGAVLPLMSVWLAAVVVLVRLRPTP